MTDPEFKEQLYTLAFTIVRADESVTGGERIYLAQLANRLGLDAPAVARLEADAAARIDAAAARASPSSDAHHELREEARMSSTPQWYMADRRPAGRARSTSRTW